MAAWLLRLAPVLQLCVPAKLNECSGTCQREKQREREGVSMCERRKEPTGCQLLGVMPNQGTGWWRLSVLWRSPGQGGKTFSTDEAYKSPRRLLRNDGGNFVSPHRGRHSRRWTLRDLDFSSPFALLSSFLSPHVDTVEFYRGFRKLRFQNRSNFFRHTIPAVRSVRKNRVFRAHPRPSITVLVNWLQEAYWSHVCGVGGGPKHKQEVGVTLFRWLINLASWNT